MEYLFRSGNRLTFTMRPTKKSRWREFFCPIADETARRFTPAGLFLLGRLLVPNTLMNLRSWNGAGFNSLVDGG
jgi:hypothetical protein